MDFIAFVKNAEIKNKEVELWQHRKVRAASAEKQWTIPTFILIKTDVRQNIVKNV